MAADGLLPSSALRVAAVLLALAAPMGDAAARSAWVIDPAHTRIAFSVDSAGCPSTEGRFRRFDGHVVVDFEHPSRSRVAFRVEAGSVDLGSPSVEAYVRSAVFLDAERHPTIAFTSTSVTRIDARRVRVVGDLTLLGRTRPLAVDVRVETVHGAARPRLRFVATARIDRLAHGMTAGWPLISGLVDLVVASEAIAP